MNEIVESAVKEAKITGTEVGDGVTIYVINNRVLERFSQCLVQMCINELHTANKTLKEQPYQEQLELDFTGFDGSIEILEKFKERILNLKY